MALQVRNVVPRLLTLRAVAAGEAIAAVCRRLGLARSTVSKWQRDPAWTTDLERARQALLTDPALQPLLQRLERLEQITGEARPR